MEFFFLVLSSKSWFPELPPRSAVKKNQGLLKSYSSPSKKGQIDHTVVVCTSVLIMEDLRVFVSALEF